MSYFFRDFYPKSAYFLGNSHFFLKNLKKSAIFCTLGFQVHWVHFKMSCVMSYFLRDFHEKSANYAYFERFSEKISKKSAIFCTTHFDPRSARPSVLVARNVPYMSYFFTQNSRKTLFFLYFEPFSPKNVKKSSIFCNFLSIYF